MCLTVFEVCRLIWSNYGELGSYSCTHDGEIWCAHSSLFPGVVSKSEIGGKWAVIRQLKWAGSKPFHSSAASWVRSDKPFPFSLDVVNSRAQVFTFAWTMVHRVLLTPKLFLLIMVIGGSRKVKSYISLLLFFIIFIYLVSAFSCFVSCMVIFRYSLRIKIPSYKYTYNILKYI